MKSGRGRVYDYAVDVGRFGPYAAQVAYLDEMAARCLDLVADLPAAVADAVPAGGTNSIHMLCLHLYWAERHWLARTVTGEALETEDLGRFVLPADWRGRAWGDVGAVLTTEREAQVKAPLARLAAGELRFTPSAQFAAAGLVLEHLKWHWVYHSGQIGLLRRLLGPRYQWTFAEPGTG